MNVRRIPTFLLPAVVLILVLQAAPASAGCTASLSCNNACHIFPYVCPPPSC